MKEGSLHTEKNSFTLNSTNIIELIYKVQNLKIYIFFMAAMFLSSVSFGQNIVDFQKEKSISKKSKVTETQIGKSYYVEPGSYGTKRETDPPRYVKSMDKMGFKAGAKLNWLDAGLDYRVRFEARHNDIRRPESFNKDFPFLLRTRAYFGIKNALDPFRFALEVEDARRYNGNYALDNRDVNTFELIQGYGELHFKKGLGKDPRGNDRPIMIRGGRMTFEFLDRRLIGLNEWRNTTNNFLGIRTSLGKDDNDWQADILVLKPINRSIDKFDKVNKVQYFYGVIGHWRRWSQHITLEPYYLALTQVASSRNDNRPRNIQGVGLRAFGWVKNSGFNYDFSYIYQLGKDNTDVQQRAYMFTGEIGYTVKSSKAKPRISLFYGHVTGDKNPDDKVNNRFERYFGFARPWQSDDYIIPENVINPKVKVEFELFKNKLKIDGGYGFYWLASSTDRFNNFLAGNSFNRDKTGSSGRFMGHGLDMRARFKPTPFMDANIGYCHFTNENFVRNRQVAANSTFSKNSDFAYIEVMFNFFDMVKHINQKKSNSSQNIIKN